MSSSGSNETLMLELLLDRIQDQETYSLGAPQVLLPFLTAV